MRQVDPRPQYPSIQTLARQDLLRRGGHPPDQTGRGAHRRGRDYEGCCVGDEEEDGDAGACAEVRGAPGACGLGAEDAVVEGAEGEFGEGRAQGVEDTEDIGGFLFECPGAGYGCVGLGGVEDFGIGLGVDFGDVCLRSARDA